VGYYNQNDGTSETAETTDLSHIFQNLSPGIYQFWVSASCGDGSYSAFIIEMEEIDGAIPDILSDFYDCTCDEFHGMYPGLVNNSIQVNWNYGAAPCLTQYIFNTTMLTNSGHTVNSSFTFSFHPGSIEELINDCDDVLPPLYAPLLSTPNEKIYILKDTGGNELYRFIIRPSNFEIKYNGSNLFHYSFNMSNCVFCPEEDKSRNESSNNSISTISLDDLEDIQIQPNPFGNSLEIRWQSTTSNSTIRVYNSTGGLMDYQALIHGQSLDSNYLKIDTHNWPSGIYFIQKEDALDKTVQKVVKF